MDERQRRKAENEVIFREVNERIESLQKQLGLADREPLNVVCECHRAECVEQIPVDVAVYERVRREGTHFIVAAGHQDPEVEDVVEDAGEYVIVGKHPGEPEQIAEANDPRS